MLAHVIIFPVQIYKNLDFDLRIVGMLKVLPTFWPVSFI